MLREGMTEDRNTPAKRMTGDRPRRRDIALTASIGVVVMLVLAVAGELSGGAFLGGAAAFIALAFVYYLTALTTAEPNPRPLAVNAPRDLEAEASVTMLERLPIPVLLIGAGGRIERANPAARTFLGLGTERGLLSTVLRQPRVLEAVSAALRGDRGATVEYSTLAPLESHVRAYVEPIRLSAPGPMPFRAMLVLADDTNSKRAERMRADFLANASHELRMSNTRRAAQPLVRLRCGSRLRPLGQHLLFVKEVMFYSWCCAAHVGIPRNSYFHSQGS